MPVNHTNSAPSNQTGLHAQQSGLTATGQGVYSTDLEALQKEVRTQRTLSVLSGSHEQQIAQLQQALEKISAPLKKLSPNADPAQIAALRVERAHVAYALCAKYLAAAANGDKDIAEKILLYRQAGKAGDIAVAELTMSKVTTGLPFELHRVHARRLIAFNDLAAELGDSARAENDTAAKLRLARESEQAFKKALQACTLASPPGQRLDREKKENIESNLRKTLVETSIQLRLTEMDRTTHLKDMLLATADDDPDFYDNEALASAQTYENEVMLFLTSTAGHSAWYQHMYDMLKTLSPDREVNTYKGSTATRLSDQDFRHFSLKVETQRFQHTFAALFLFLPRQRGEAASGVPHEFEEVAQLWFLKAASKVDVLLGTLQALSKSEDNALASAPRDNLAALASVTQQLTDVRSQLVWIIAQYHAWQPAIDGQGTPPAVISQIFDDLEKAISFETGHVTAAVAALDEQARLQSVKAGQAALIASAKNTVNTTSQDLSVSVAELRTGKRKKRAAGKSGASVEASASSPPQNLQTPAPAPARHLTTARLSGHHLIHTEHDGILLADVKNDQASAKTVGPIPVQFRREKHQWVRDEIDPSVHDLDALTLKTEQAKKLTRQLERLQSQAQTAQAQAQKNSRLAQYCIRNRSPFSIWNGIFELAKQPLKDAEKRVRFLRQQGHQVASFSIVRDLLRSAEEVASRLESDITGIETARLNAFVDSPDAGAMTYALDNDMVAEVVLSIIDKPTARPNDYFSEYQIYLNNLARPQIVHAHSAILNPRPQDLTEAHIILPGAATGKVENRMLGYDGKYVRVSASLVSRLHELANSRQGAAS